MKSTWTYRDLVDLEFFLNLDEDMDQARLHERDRSIYLSESDDSTNNDTGKLLYSWLQSRRNDVFSGREGKSPGSLLDEAFSRLRTIVLVLVVGVGMAAGLSFFSYSGTTPVNVFHFLFIFVFSQLALYLILLFLLFIRLSGRQQLPSVMVRLYGTLVSIAASRVGRRILERLPAESRHRYEQALGLIRKNKSYGSQLYWPLFTLSQLVMLFFNIGLLAATLFRIITSDIAFGWQSTIQFTAPAIFRTVQLLAAPWSWLVTEQYAYPSLAEIEGSQIILKDGIYHLATQDLVSWWPFLVLCLLFYGLFLRSLLVVFGFCLQHQSAKSLTFTKPAHRRILQRMTTPILSTQAGPANGPVPDSAPEKRLQQQRLSPAAPEHPLTLLIPVDIIELCRPQELIDLLRQQGYLVERHEIIRGDYDADQSVLEKLGETDWQANSGLIILFEAWMVPINDSLHFLKNLRLAVGRETPVYVGLIGRTRNGVILAPPTPGERSIWQQKLDSLGDPFLLVQEFYRSDDT